MKRKAFYEACEQACSYATNATTESSKADELSIIQCLLENGADPTFEKLNEPRFIRFVLREGGGMKTGWISLSSWWKRGPMMS